MSRNHRFLFIWFYLAKILANLAVFAFLPILPLFLTHRQADVVQVGMFFSALALARLAFGLLGGWFADTVGHLRGLALGSLFGVCAFLVLLLAPGWGWALAGMVLIHAAGALTTPSQSAFVGEMTNQNRGKAFGLMNTIHGAAQMGGPALGGWLVAAGGFPLLFKLTGGLYLAAAMIRLVLAAAHPTTRSTEGASVSLLRNDLLQMRNLVFAGGVLAWMLIADGFGDIAMSLTETYQPIFLEDAAVSITKIGLIGSIAYGATLVSHALAGWMVDRYGERLPIFLSFGFTGIGILAFVAAPDWIGFAAAWALIGLMWGLGATAYDSLISKTVPPKHRGLAYGLFSTAQGFFSLPVPLLGGWLYLAGPSVPFVAAAFVSLLGAVVTMRFFPGGLVRDINQSESILAPTS